MNTKSMILSNITTYESYIVELESSRITGERLETAKAMLNQNKALLMEIEKAEKEAARKTQKAQEPMPQFQTVYNLLIAESLCADYPFFRDLVRIEQNRRHPSQQVYIFKNSVALQEALRKLIAEVMQMKDEREKINREIDSIKERKI